MRRRVWGLQHSLPLGLFTRWTFRRLTDPLKPPILVIPGFPATSI